MDVITILVLILSLGYTQAMPMTKAEHLTECQMKDLNQALNAMPLSIFESHLKTLAEMTKLRKLSMAMSKPMNTVPPVPDYVRVRVR